MLYCSEKRWPTWPRGHEAMDHCTPCAALQVSSFLLPPPSMMSTTSVPRSSRFRIHSDTVLGTAHTIAQLTKDVTEIANVPFVSTAASLVLSVLEIVKNVKDNNDARVRLAKMAATYLIELKPILATQESSEDLVMPPELRLRLEKFQSALVELRSELETMKKQNFLKRILGKDRISTILLDRKDDLQASFNALQMWTNVNTYALVRKAAKEPDADDGILRFDQTQIVLKATLKANSGFFSKLELGELRADGNHQRVLVKRFANKTERDDEAKKWRKLWHANLPQLAGCSNDRSTMQFILFHDEYHTSKQRTEIRSLAAFILEISRSHDVFSLTTTIVDFINDAISAIRHIQVMLKYDEDEAAHLARITKYTVSGDGRVVVTPPLQALTKFGGGVQNSLYNSLFPANGTSESSMRRYFAELDDTTTHAALTDILDREQLDKWAVLDSLAGQLRITPDGCERPQQYVMPETRWAMADYSVDIKPGDFGVLVPGEQEEYAFRRVANSAANNSALFEYQSRHLVYDRNTVFFDEVCKQPKTWRLDRMTDGCIFTHQHYQELTHAVHRSKRSLQLSAPKDCDVDELVFVVGVWRYRHYQYALRSESLGESQPADVYASLPNWNSHELLFRHCAPGPCYDSCDHSLDSRVSIERYGDYMHIEYVTVPVAKRTTMLETPAENSHRPWAPRFKEYESIIPRRNETEKRFSAEWP